MRFAEIDPNTLTIIDIYNNYSLIHKVSDTFIKIPENLNYQCIEAYKDENGTILLREVSNQETIENIRQINVNSLRQKRNAVLSQTDKYIVADYPHATPEIRQTWLDYRQVLRDLPTATEDPANVVWPVRPDEVVVVEEETSNVVVEEETSNVVVEEESSNVA
jgi:hypothetical protein